MSTDTHDRARPPVWRRWRMLPALFAALAAVVLLAACGSSGGASSTSASSSGEGTSTTGSPGGGRFASLRTCLQKEGINLPAPKGAPRQGGQPGQGGQGGPGAGGGRPGGFLKAPEGVSEAKFQEALKKCGAQNFAGRGSRNLSSPTARAALTSYATCMREHGVSLPAPNTSGKGPVFNTSAINTSSTAFKSAQKACQSDLAGAFAAGGGSPQPAT
jgi:hypothetical protein